MGHQFAYFMTPNDIENVRRNLAKAGPFLILLNRAETQTPNVVNGFDAQWRGDPWLFYYLVRPEDLKDVVMSHVPNQGYWCVDTLFSPVIEFGRNFFDGKILKSERVYYQDGYHAPGGEFVMKNEAFRKWARSVLARMKKGMRRIGDGFYYIAPDAEAWAASGGKLMEDSVREVSLL